MSRLADSSRRCAAFCVLAWAVIAVACGSLVKNPKGPGGNPPPPAQIAMAFALRADDAVKPLPVLAGNGDGVLGNVTLAAATLTASRIELRDSTTSTVVGTEAGAPFVVDLLARTVTPSPAFEGASQLTRITEVAFILQDGDAAADPALTLRGSYESTAHSVRAVRFGLSAAVAAELVAPIAGGIDLVQGANVIALDLAMGQWFDFADAALNPTGTDFEAAPNGDLDLAASAAAPVSDIFAVVRQRVVASVSAQISAGDTPPVASSAPTEAAAPLGASASWLTFDAAALPKNAAGETLPSIYDSLGMGTVALDENAGVHGNAAAVTVTSGELSPQFFSSDGVKRGFVRDTVPAGTPWQRNTYNRLRFWIKAPANAAPLAADGHTNLSLQAYVKRVADADPYNDSAGGGLYFYALNVPNVDAWTQVVLSQHPAQASGGNPNEDLGVVDHPTNEADASFFDAMSRLIFDSDAPQSYPATFRLDDFTFYQDLHADGDADVFDVTSTYVRASRRMILTWQRRADRPEVAHEVRYAYSSVHAIGWEAATAAPQGVIQPPGDGAYNGMVYDTTALPLAGHSRVFLAIRPVGAAGFFEIEVPLTTP
jgi:hypothetical protein